MTLQMFRFVIGRLRIVLLLSFLASSSNAVGLDEERAQLLSQKYFPSGPINREALKSISGEDRHYLIERLHALYKELSKQLSERDAVRGSVVLHLALLGDDWGREMVVLSFWYESGHNHYPLLILQDPKTLPMLGEGLFMEEPLPDFSGDDRYIPPQLNILDVFGRVLTKAPDFSREVTAWAQRNLGRNGDRTTLPMLAIMRDWYRANEARLKAGNFAAVEPGRDLPANLQPESLPVAAASAASPASGPISQAATPPGTPSRQTPSVKMDSGSNNGGAWIAVAAGSLILAGGAIIWKWRRRGSP